MTRRVAVPSRELLLALCLLGSSAWAAAEGPPEAAAGGKLPIHGEVGLGVGQTLYFKGLRSALQASIGGSTDPGLGQNLMFAFAVAPPSWHGLGLGARIKGTFGSPVDVGDGSQIIFNYYTVGVMLKYHPLSGGFGQGPYARLTAGFGQLTTKRQDEASRLYRHQYAIGLSVLAALGYTYRFGTFGLGLEAEFDYSNREGTVDGSGGTSFASGQLGGNVVLSF